MVAVADDRYAPGQLLDEKYRVVQKIGEGGMGEVLLARHTELDRNVAIKVLRADLAKDTGAVERFLREARAAARIESDHVVHVFDVERFVDGRPYIVMEYLEGEDLGRIASRGAMSVGQAVEYVLHACEGVAEAHRVGVIHRDLKPENLFLARRRDGGTTLKVVDFGISKLAPSGARRELAITTGQLLGTPFYMSPEQLRGDATVDERSDVWALGVILFELVTADAPFHGDTLPQLCTHIMHDPAKRLSEVRSDLSFPPGLEDVVDRCLAKDPASRYASAGELAAALAPFAPSPVEATLTPMRAWAPSGPEVVVTSRTAPVPLVVRRRRTSGPLVVLAAGAAIVVVAGVGAVKMTSAPPVAAVPSASTAVGTVSATPSVRDAPSAPPLGSSASPPAPTPRPRSPLTATKPAPTSKIPSTSRPPADDFGGRL